MSASVSRAIQKLLQFFRTGLHSVKPFFTNLDTKLGDSQTPTFLKSVMHMKRVNFGHCCTPVACLFCNSECTVLPQLAIAVGISLA